MKNWPTPADLVAMSDGEFRRFLDGQLRPARPGWSSRWRTVFAAVVELAVFLLLIAAFFGITVLVWASTVAS